MPDTVILKRVTTYDSAAVGAAVEAILNACGAGELLKGKKRILVKPNLLMRSDPGDAVTTNPAVLAAVLWALKRRGAGQILVADSPGGPYSALLLRAVYGGCGLLSLEEIPGVRLNYDTGSRAVAANGRLVKQFDITDAVAEADLIVNVGKLKTHAMCGMSAAVKNLFGAVPGLAKPEMHTRFSGREDFSDMLIDLAELVRPQISLIDGIVGMEGNGPSGGTPRAFGILAGSRNPYHLDCALAHWIGMGHGEALTVAASVARGLAPEYVSGLLLDDEDHLMLSPVAGLQKPRTAEIDVAKKLPGFLQKPASRLLKRLDAHPVILRKICVGCGKCAEICPQKTIRMENGKAVIQKENCIRCFCCHEICPRRAMDIRRGRGWVS